MRTMLARDLTIGMRTRAFVMVLTAHVALLAAFVLVWSGGVPTLPGENVYEQQRLFQAVVLACLLPWAAVRCGPGDRGAGLTMLAMVTARPPAGLVRMQCAALFIMLAAAVLAGLPVMLVTGQLAAVPIAQTLVDTMPMLALAAFAATNATIWSLMHADRLAVWLGATISTAVIASIAAMSLPRDAATAVLFIVSLVGAAVAAGRADAALLYLGEDAA
jgi:hypothetical protein